MAVVVGDFHMVSITVRNIEDGLQKRLRNRAAENGRSMEEEVREILRTALSHESQTQRNLAHAIRSRFAPLGGVELDLPPRSPIRKPPQYD